MPKLKNRLSVHDTMTRNRSTGSAIGGIGLVAYLFSIPLGIVVGVFVLIASLSAGHFVYTDTNEAFLITAVCMFFGGLILFFSGFAFAASQ